MEVHLAHSDVLHCCVFRRGQILFWWSCHRIYLFVSPALINGTIPASLFFTVWSDCTFQYTACTRCLWTYQPIYFHSSLPLWSHKYWLSHCVWLAVWYTMAECRLASLHVPFVTLMSQHASKPFVITITFFKSFLQLQHLLCVLFLCGKCNDTDFPTQHCFIDHK